MKIIAVRENDEYELLYSGLGTTNAWFYNNMPSVIEAEYPDTRVFLLTGSAADSALLAEAARRMGQPCMRPYEYDFHKRVPGAWRAELTPVLDKGSELEGWLVGAAQIYPSPEFALHVQGYGTMTFQRDLAGVFFTRWSSMTGEPRDLSPDEILAILQEQAS